MNIAYNLVFKKGLFSDECKKIKRLPVAQKTWRRFKTDFTKAHQDLREEGQTILTAGYGTENSVATFHSQKAVALGNLAATTIADRTIINTLTETNAKLVKDITELTNK